MLGPVPFSAFNGLYLCFNVVQSSRNHMFLELKFIVDLIFLTKFQKLALQRNFDVNKIPTTGRPVFLLKQI